MEEEKITFDLSEEMYSWLKADTEDNGETVEEYLAEQLCDMYRQESGYEAAEVTVHLGRNANYGEGSLQEQISRALDLARTGISNPPEDTEYFPNTFESALLVQTALKDHVQGTGFPVTVEVPKEVSDCIKEHLVAGEMIGHIAHRAHIMWHMNQLGKSGDIVEVTARLSTENMAYLRRAAILGTGWRETIMEALRNMREYNKKQKRREYHDRQIREYRNRDKEEHVGEYQENSRCTPYRH